MKILVTGGSGYLGKQVTAFLGADDFSRRSGHDMLDEADAEMVRDYDLVVHLAADLDKRHESANRVFRSNVDGTVNLLRAMREDAAFVFASTKDVYGRFADNFAEVDESCPTLYSGQSPLEWSKLIAERYVEYYAHERRFRACIFRLSTVYGPDSEGNTPGFVGAYADAVNTGEPIRLPGGGGPRRDLLHVDDLSRACSAFADSVIRHGLYNLGGGRKNSTTLRDLVKTIEEVSGLQAVVDDSKPLPAPIPLNYVSDLTRVRQELDWEPETDIAAGLATLFNK
ncbi:MAG: NAD(P)-dependent oxidoreductase [Acidobacteriota bacterium]